MKTKLLLSFLLSFSFYLLSSQVPQGFNYQAIARDPLNSNNPITGTSLQVKLGILSDTIANTMVWEELFNPVKTNAFGMFNIVVGTGVKQTGSAASFSAIDWTKTPLFLRTTIYYQSAWKVMGTTKLQSVPYSMVAGNLEGSVPLLSVKGNTTTMDSALFVVRNNTGQIVFAVYNEGVRIYVDDGLAKGATKGGFAIGSFDRSKGTSQPLFIVDPDSIRGYIDNNPVKAVKGGFAIGGFDRSKATGNQQFLTVSDDSVRIYINDDLLSKAVKGGFAIGSFDKSKGGNTNFFNVSPDSTGRIYPSQNRILWYPLKNALLAGKVIAENKDSIGVNSFASGYESRSKGKYSQALGFKAIARGDYSTAIGKYAIANAGSSFALGDSAFAMNSQTYAFGYNTISSGLGSLALGYKAQSIGQDAIALGSGTQAIGQGSFALGFIGRDSAGIATGNTKAIGDWSMAMGMGAQALEKGSFSLGINCIAEAPYSFALGYYSTSKSWYGFAAGYQCLSKREGDVALGYRTEASGYYSTAMGENSKAQGIGAFAVGSYSIASQPTSIAMGDHAISYGEHAIAIGSSAQSPGTFSLALGTVVKSTKIYATSIGSNCVASGTGSTAIGKAVTASGDYSSALGYNTNSKPYGSFVLGMFNDTSLFYSGTIWDARDPIFIVGNGTSSTSRSNALTVLKNSNVGIGTSNPQATLEINGGSGDRLAFWRSADNTLEVQTLLDGIALSSYPYGGDAQNKLVLQPLVGNVGIGTASPAYKLEVVGRIRLQSGGGSAGINLMNLANTAERGFIGMYDDNNIGFYGGGGANWGFMMNVNNGYIGIGTPTPQGKFAIRNGSYGGLLINVVSDGASWLGSYTNIQTGDYAWTGGATWSDLFLQGKGGNVGIGILGTGGYKLYVNGTAYSTGGWAGSDIRWKKNIVPITDVLGKLLDLNGVNYEWRKTEFPEINFDDGQQIGLIAQDVEKIFPSLVRTDKNGYKAVSYEKLSVVLLEGIKEQQKQIESQQKEIDELKALVNTIAANQKNN